MARKDKPRKWANLKGQVPDDPGQVELTPRTLEVIAEADKRRVKEDGTAVTMDDLAQEWSGLEEEEEFEDLAKDKRNIQYDALTRRILEELERVKAIAGTDLWRGDGQTFSPKFMLNIRVTDPIKLRAWVEETNQQHLLTVPRGRLNGIVGEAMNLDLAAAMTPAERFALKPGQPGSGQPPPGVEVSLFTTVHHTAPGKRTRGTSDADDAGPF
jgi:hypothetical protein